MTGRRTAVGISILALLALWAFGATSASAFQTAVTCAHRDRLHDEHPGFHDADAGATLTASHLAITSQGTLTANGNAASLEGAFTVSMEGGDPVSLIGEGALEAEVAIASELDGAVGSLL